MSDEVTWMKQEMALYSNEYDRYKGNERMLKQLKSKLKELGVK